MRTLNRLSIATAAVAALALAACSDAPATAPAIDAAANRTPASLGQLQAIATVTLGVKDYVSGLMIPGTTMAFNTGFDGRRVHITDNDASDADKRDGYFKVQMPKGSVYEARPVAAPSKYNRIDELAQIGTYATTVNLGTMVLRHNPKFTIEVRTPSNTTSAFNLVGFATFSVGWADGSAPWMLRTDNVDDMDPTVGKITFYGKYARTHQFCMTSAPAGYLIPTVNCITKAGELESWHTVSTVVYPKLF